MHLSLQVDISRKEDSLVNIVIEGLNADTEFGVVNKNGIRGLALADEWGHNCIHLEGVMPGKVHAFA